MKRKWLLCLMLIFIVDINDCFSKDMDVMEVAARLQKTYEQTSSMTADFDQTTTSQMSSRERTGKGSIALVKPGKMRWDYVAPDKQVFVCDGKTISMYFAKEMQMVISSARQYLESDIVYSFFAGKGNILKDFSVLPGVENLLELPGTYPLKIIPKEGHSQVDYINLWADRSSFLLRRIEVTDKFGSVTTITFSNIMSNAAVNADIFSFVPPDGTEIVSQ